jgi:hypothetical protein
MRPDNPDQSIDNVRSSSDYIKERLKHLQPLVLEQVPRTSQEPTFNSLMEEHHYLGWHRLKLFLDNNPPMIIFGSPEARPNGSPVNVYSGANIYRQVGETVWPPIEASSCRAG